MLAEGVTKTEVLFVVQNKRMILKQEKAATEINYTSKFCADLA